MIKFFTPALASLLACGLPGLAWSQMVPSSPTPVLESAQSTGSAVPGLPTSLRLADFAPLAKKSPFTLASTTEENADFAKNLVLSGYFQMGGKDFVLVADRTRPERLTVGTSLSPRSGGLTLVRIDKEAGGGIKNLKALIRKGTETALLKYEADPGPAAGIPPPNPGPMQIPGQVPPLPQANLPPGGGPPQVSPVVRQRKDPIPVPPVK